MSGLVCIVNKVADGLGYTLKPLQKQVIDKLCASKRCVCFFTTGYGRTLYYACLPKVYDNFHSKHELSYVFISPLISIMKEQSATVFNSLGIKTGSDHVCHIPIQHYYIPTAKLLYMRISRPFFLLRRVWLCQTSPGPALIGPSQNQVGQTFGLSSKLIILCETLTTHIVIDTSETCSYYNT